MKKNRLQTLCKISLLGAIAAIVMYFDISLPFVPAFYKLDFSETIVLLSGFTLGAIPAIITEAVKNILILLIKGTATAGIGELANFIMGCSFVLPAVLFYHKKKTKKNAAIGLCLSVISLCIVASLMNYYIMLPAYAYFFQMDIDALVAMGSAVNTSINSLFTLIILGVVPFNIIKGSLNALLILLTYKKLKPIIKKR